MKAIAASVAAVALLCSSAASAQNVTASRVYKLCVMEDPSCMSLIRGAYDRSMAAEAKKPKPAFCPQGYRMSDQQIATTFLQVGQTEPAALAYPLDYFETYVLSYALPCR